MRLQIITQFTGRRDGHGPASGVQGHKTELARGVGRSPPLGPHCPAFFLLGCSNPGFPPQSPKLAASKRLLLANGLTIIGASSQVQVSVACVRPCRVCILIGLKSAHACAAGRCHTGEGHTHSGLYLRCVYSRWDGLVTAHIFTGSASCLPDNPPSSRRHIRRQPSVLATGGATGAGGDVQHQASAGGLRG